jgi:hypothetical protein
MILMMPFRNDINDDSHIQSLPNWKDPAMIDAPLLSYRTSDFGAAKCPRPKKAMPQTARYLCTIPAKTFFGLEE